MLKLFFLQALACFIALAPSANRSTVRADDRPNILFIFSDDHAQAAISAYGSKVNTTPHLDRLAKEGARFLNSFVTNSICTPSRATLLTGQYSHLNGVPVFNRFDGSRDHVAKRLQQSGYHTGMIGKWHLGSDPTGFDRWIVLPGQGAYWNPQFLVPGHKLTIEGHCTQITTQLGIEFLDTRPADKPFFLMLHHKAPHREWEPDTKNKEAFRNRTFPEPSTLWDDYATRPAALPENQQTIANDLTRRDLKLTPPVELQGQERNKWLGVKPTSVQVDGKTLEGKELVRWKYQRYMQDYLACVQGVDDSIGAMLDYLDKKGLAKNTIVIYTADNGWYMGELGMYDKRFMYEPGLRSPLIIRGPGIPAGSTPEAISLVPVLQGQTPSDWRKSVYYRYYHDPGHHNTAAHYGVRTATHKLIYYWRKDVYEMFDLANDPNEQNNLLHDPQSANRPATQELFKELKGELGRLQVQYQDDGKYADPKTWPSGGSDGPFDDKTPLGKKTVAEAIQSAQGPQAQ